MSDILADGSSGSNGVTVPSGDQSQTQTQTNQGSNGDSGGGGQVYDLAPDSMIRVPGEKEPVKYSEYVSRFVPKADFTKAQQAKAAEANQLRNQLAQIQAQQNRNNQPQQQNQPNPIDTLAKNLEGKPYISGAEAAQMVKGIWEGGITNLAKAIGQRDQVIGLLYKRLMAVDKTVGSLNGRTTQQDFQQRMSSVRSQLNLPDDPAVSEIMQDIYYSHEGEDLDREFPNMVKARWDALQKLIRLSDQKRANDARQQTLRMPGRGGNATPSRPARQGFKTAKELADDLFPAPLGNQT